MLLSFFAALRAHRVPVSLREFLALLEALQADLANKSVDDFYYLARAVLVKDERHIDRFDQAFASAFKGVISESGDSEDLQADAAIPQEWLRKLTEKYLSDEEKAEIEALGGWDKLMETLKQRLQEQQGRHQGGNKWIGTGGTSPFGAYGYNPEGVRIGQDGNRNFRAVKVWDKRAYRDLDGDVELGTRNIKVALKKLRAFARSGAADELDLDGTIKATANQGFLDVQLRPERRNAVKVLMFFDVGGSMDWHIQTVEELFSAARSEFKHLEYYYFHNCPYEFMWRNNARRWSERTPTWDVLHKYPSDYRVIFVGDAAMSPYEIAVPGGAVEHMNPEAGAVWLERFTTTFPNLVWLNPVAQEHWRYTQSTQMVSQLIGPRMFPLTLNGLEGATRALLAGGKTAAPLSPEPA